MMVPTKTIWMLSTTVSILVIMGCPAGQDDDADDAPGYTTDDLTLSCEAVAGGEYLVEQGCPAWLLVNSNMALCFEAREDVEVVCQLDAPQALIESTGVSASVFDLAAHSLDTNEDGTVATILFGMEDATFTVLEDDAEVVLRSVNPYLQFGIRDDPYLEGVLFDGYFFAHVYFLKIGLANEPPAAAVTTII